MIIESKLKIMKMKLIPSLLMMIVFGITLSCTKTNPNPTPAPVTVNPTFTANIGGNAWTATPTGSLYTTYINIDGTAADGTKLKVTFPQDIKAGTYTIGSGSQSSLSYTTSSGVYSAVTGGNLVIASNANNIVKGSWNGVDLEFYVSSKPTIYGTSGNFEAKYQ